MFVEELNCEKCGKQFTIHGLPLVLMASINGNGEELICYDCFHARIPLLSKLIKVSTTESEITAAFDTDYELLSEFNVAIPENGDPIRREYAKKILMTSIAQGLKHPDRDDPMLQICTLVYGSRNPYNIPYDVYMTGISAANIAAQTAVSELLYLGKTKNVHRPKARFGQYCYYPFNADWKIEYELQCGSDLEIDNIYRKFRLIVRSRSFDRDIIKCYRIDFMSALMGSTHAIMQNPFTQLTQIALHDIIQLESNYRTLDSFLLKK